jgi:hypothetical protein
MSGIYNYHVKVEHPNKILPQMSSYQPPHFFGGSQVPINLNIPHNKQMEVDYMMSNNPIGSGLYVSKHRNVMRPSKFPLYDA